MADAHPIGLLARLLPFVASPSRRRRRTGAALFAAELVPVVGVAFLGWSLGEMLLVYFCEAVILAALVPVKLLVAGAPGLRGRTLTIVLTAGWLLLAWVALYVYAVLVMGIASVLEYERFKPAGDGLLAHLRIVLAGSPDTPLTLAGVLAHPVTHAVVAFLAAELVAFFVHFIGDREYRHGAGRHVAQVARRVAVLHVALVYGGIVVMFPLLAYAPAAAAPAMTAAFVLGKLLLDLRAHERDHAALA